MWKQDIQKLLAIWDNAHLIQRLAAVYDGLLVTDTSGKQFIFNHRTETLTELGGWKRNERK